MNPNIVVSDIDAISVPAPKVRGGFVNESFMGKVTTSIDITTIPINVLMVRREVEDEDFFDREPQPPMDIPDGFEEVDA